MPLFRRRQILPNKLWLCRNSQKSEKKLKCTHFPPFFCLSASMIDEFTDEKKKNVSQKKPLLKKWCCFYKIVKAAGESQVSIRISQQTFFVSFWHVIEGKNPHIDEDQKGFWPFKKVFDPQPQTCNLEVFYHPSPCLLVKRNSVTENCLRKLLNGDFWKTSFFLLQIPIPTLVGFSRVWASSCSATTYYPLPKWL